MYNHTEWQQIVGALVCSSGLQSVISRITVTGLFVPAVMHQTSAHLLANTSIVCICLRCYTVLGMTEAHLPKLLGSDSQSCVLLVLDFR